MCGRSSGVECWGEGRDLRSWRIQECFGDKGRDYGSYDRVCRQGALSVLMRAVCRKCSAKSLGF